MIVHHPPWWDKPWRPQVQQAPASCDVVVVGGGLTGVVAALELSARGHEVVILDAQPFGRGATGRAFGSIAIGCSADLHSLGQRYGSATAESIWCDSSAGAHRFYDYLRRHGIDADYRRNGHLRVATTDTEARRIRADYTVWRAQLPREDIRLLDPAQLQAELPGTAFRIGLLDESSATVNPYRLLSALVRAFQSSGGNYVQECQVMRLAPSSAGHVATHTHGSTTARHVLIATNGYTGGVVPWVGSRVRPVGSYLIATAPLPMELRCQLVPHGRTVTIARRPKNYFRFDTEDRLLFGGRLSEEVDLPLERVHDELRARMAETFPQLADARVTHVWGGRMGFTADTVPHVGTHNGLHYALGGNGRGLPTSIDLGLRAATLIDAPEFLSGAGHLVPLPAFAEEVASPAGSGSR